MPQDLFGRLVPSFGGAFAADAALMTFGGLTTSAAVGLITQRISFQYQQRIHRYWEIGTPFTYYVAGRPEGSADADRILGPRRLAFEFYFTYGNVCNAGGNDIVFTMQQGCLNPFDPQAQGNAQQLTLAGCVIDSVRMSIQDARDMVVNENVHLQFVTIVPGDFPQLVI